jgi:hypothetical protein
MSRLEDLARRARAEAPCWDADRASRVLAGAVDKRERRAARTRMARRALGGASAALVVGLVLLRGASTTAASTSPTSTSPSSTTPLDPGSASINAPAAEPLAVRDGDGGYARD